MKRPTRIALTVITCIAGLLLAAYLSRNLIARGLVQSTASAMLKVPVTIESIDLDLFGADVTVTGIAVGNPKGYAPPHALTAKKLAVQLDAGASSLETLVVTRIGIEGVDAWFLLDGTRNNISDIVNGMSAADAPANEKPAAGGGVEVLIRTLELRDIAVHVSERPDVADVPVTAKLASVTATDISSRSSGSKLAGQLASKAFEATMGAIVSDMGGRLPAAIAKGVGDSLSQAGTVLKDVAGQAAKQVGEAATKGVGDAVKGIGEGLGGLLGGDRKK
jgi:hypothetical protein